MVWGHQQFCIFPALSGASLRCICWKYGRYQSPLELHSKAICLKNFVTESPARAQPPMGEHRHPGRFWLSPRSREAQGSQHSQVSWRRAVGLTATAILKLLQKLQSNPGTSWVLLNETVSFLFCLGNRKEGKFFLCQEKKYSSPTDLNTNFSEKLIFPLPRSPMLQPPV